MRTAKIALAALALALSVSASGFGMSVKRAPDETPLLFDRVRAFDSIVTATAAEGFEKQTEPVPSTNCVYLTVTIDKVLKGGQKAGDKLRIDCHNMLPGLLAQRDKGTNRRYLLVLKTQEGRAWLGAAELYGDLDRFILTDDSLEKAVGAFAAAKDTSPAGVLNLCADLLGDAALSERAGGHVTELLTRGAAGGRLDEAVTRKAAEAAVERLIARAKRGLNVDSAAEALDTFARAGFKPEDKLWDKGLGEAGRKWLKAAVDSGPDAARPDYRQADSVASVVRMLGKVRDAASADLLGSVAKSARWPVARGPAITALVEALAAAAEEPLRALLKDFDRAGQEGLYNAVVDALAGIGKGEGLEKKPVRLVLPPLE